MKLSWAQVKLFVLRRWCQLSFEELKEMVWVHTRQAIISEHMGPIHALLATTLVANHSLPITVVNLLKLLQAVVILLQQANNERNDGVFMSLCRVATSILLNKMFVAKLQSLRYLSAKEIVIPCNNLRAILHNCNFGNSPEFDKCVEDAKLAINTKIVSRWWWQLLY